MYRKTLFVCLLLITASLCSGRLNSQPLQWEHIYPIVPGLGYVADAERGPDGTMYALSDGLFRSTDDGRSWVELPPISEKIGRDVFAYEIAIDSSGNVLLGFYRDGGHPSSLYRSADRGETWEDLPIPGKSINALAVGTDGTYFVGLAVGTTPLLRSTDQGTTWEPLLPGDFRINLKGLAVMPTGVLLGSLYNPAGRVHQLMRSEDNGETWSDAFKQDGSIQGGLFSALIPFDSSIVFARYSSLRLPTNTLWSTDGGKTWDDFIVDSAETDGIQIAFTTHHHIIFRTSGGTWRSTDSGKHWERLPIPPSPGITQIGSLFVTPDYEFVEIARGGPRYSVDTGQTWTETGEDIRTLSDAFITAGDSLLWGASQGITLFALDQDDQSRFQQRILPQTTMHALLSSTRGTVYMISKDSIYKKGAKDSQFNPVTPYKEATRNGAATLVRDTTEYLLIGSANGRIAGLDFTANRWMNFTIVPETPDTPVHRIAVADNHTLLAASRNRVYRIDVEDLFRPTPEVGWENVLELGEEIIIQDISILDNGLAACVAGKSLWYSEDYGKTWRESSSPEFIRRNLAVQVLRDGSIMVSSEVLADEGELEQPSGTDGRIAYQLYTIDPTADRWEPDHEGIHPLHPVIDVVESDNGSLYALTDQSGIYKARTTSTVPVAGEASLPSLSMSIQPNPTSDWAVLTINNGRAGTYHIALVNGAGQMVYRKRSVVLSGNQWGYTIDLHDLPSGTYRCEVISTSSREQTSAAVLILR